MQNIPKKIYLQVDADGETPDDFNDLEVSWSSNKIHDNDIEYVLAQEAVSKADLIKKINECSTISRLAKKIVIEFINSLNPQNNEQ